MGIEFTENFCCCLVLFPLLDLVMMGSKWKGNNMLIEQAKVSGRDATQNTGEGSDRWRQVYRLQRSMLLTSQWPCLWSPEKAASVGYKNGAGRGIQFKSLWEVEGYFNQSSEVRLGEPR